MIGGSIGEPVVLAGLSFGYHQMEEYLVTLHFGRFVLWWSRLLVHHDLHPIQDYEILSSAINILLPLYHQSIVSHTLLSLIFYLHFFVSLLHIYLFSTFFILFDHHYVKKLFRNIYLYIIGSETSVA